MEPSSLRDDDKQGGARGLENVLILVLFPFALSMRSLLSKIDFFATLNPFFVSRVQRKLADQSLTGQLILTVEIGWGYCSVM